MHTELDVLRDVAERLEAAEIDYMLTGSMAMNYYAEPRMTRDMDIVLSLQTDKASDFFKLFEDGYYVSQEEIDNALKYDSMFNVIDQALVVKVDFIIRKTDEYSLVAFERRRQLKADSFMVWAISKEDLILAKLLWFKASESPQQRRDVQNLINLPYDETYVQFWATKLGVDALLNDVRQ